MNEEQSQFNLENKTTNNFVEVEVHERALDVTREEVAKNIVNACASAYISEYINASDDKRKEMEHNLTDEVVEYLRQYYLQEKGLIGGIETVIESKATKYPGLVEEMHGREYDVKHSYNNNNTIIDKIKK